MQIQAENLRLFKYVPPERIDILENEKIAFTPPDRFKDPFEMQLCLAAETARKHIRQLLVELEERAEREIPGYRNLSHRQRKKGRRDMVKMADATKHFQEGFEKTIQKQSADMGVLSLCETCNSNLMWYHYADGHRGFVLEFNSEHKEFRQLGAPWKVEYTNKPPILDHLKSVPLFFKYKPNYLQHEVEYRIVRPLHECIREEIKGLTVYFRKLPRSCIQAVYLGHRMDPEVRQRVLQLLNGTKRFDVIPNNKSYTLSFQEISSNA